MLLSIGGGENGNVIHKMAQVNFSQVEISRACEVDESLHDTVEAAVRALLSKALGGVHGTVEAAVPTVGFTVAYLITKELKLSLIIGVGSALVLLAGPAERQHCSTCGWIEAKRELVPQLMDPHALKIFEYTLRMADGSVSLFQETQPTSWRLGERVMLIEGGQ